MLLLGVFSLVANAQSEPEVIGGSSFDSQAPVIQSQPGRGTTVETPPPPVVINGKRADQLSDDEIVDFLAQKVRDVQQPNDAPVLIRLSPGYPVTLTFDKPVTDFEIGDAGMVSLRQSANRIILRAKRAQGSTRIDVFFSDRTIRTYHVFIVPTFVNADGIVNIQTADDADHAAPANPQNLRAALPQILNVIHNYELMSKERVITTLDVKRTRVFKKDPLTGFIYYDIFAFKSGYVAMTFGWENTYPNPVRLDESRFRVAFGHSLYIPDFVSINKPVLGPKEGTGGVIVFASPIFALNQPMEFVWK